MEQRVTRLQVQTQIVPTLGKKMNIWDFCSLPQTRHYAYALHKTPHDVPPVLYENT